MLSLIFVLGSVICLALAIAWPKPAVPPLNPQYRNWHNDPAWHLFQRQRNRYSTFLFVTIVLFIVFLNLAILFY